MNNDLTVFVVVGRLGKSLTTSKVMPIISCDKISNVFVFREEKGFEINGVRYITLPIFITKIKIKFFYKIIRFIYESLQLLAYSILYKPSYINGVYTLPCGLMSMIVSKIVGCKNIVSVIGEYNELLKSDYKFPNLWKKINKFSFKGSSIVTTKGRKTTNYLVSNGISEDKIFEFCGSVDMDKFKIEPNVKRDIDILFVGKFSRLKGPDRVLKVINNLRKDFPKIISYFLGDGYLFDTIREEIKKLHLEKNIMLLGYVNNPAQYFQRSKILIMPSRSEGLSTTMLEAMACGCVPIVSNVGNMTEAAHHNVNAMVVNDHTDIETFTKYAKELLIDETKREMLSRNGCQLVNEKYSVGTQAGIIENILTYTNRKI